MKIIIFCLLLIGISCDQLFLPNDIPVNYTLCSKDPIIHINQTFTMTVPTKGENSTYIFVFYLNLIFCFFFFKKKTKSLALFPTLFK